MFFTPYGNVLTGKGLFKLVAKIHIAYLVFFLLMSFILVSPDILNLGSTGLAAALLLSNILLGCLFVIFNQIRIPNLVILGQWPLMVFGVLCAFIAFWIYQNIQLTLFEKIIFAVIYFMVYWGLGILFRLIKSQNWYMLLELVNMKKMVKYIRSELIDREGKTK